MSRPARRLEGGAGSDSAGTPSGTSSSARDVQQTLDGLADRGSPPALSPSRSREGPHRVPLRLRFLLCLWVSPLAPGFPSRSREGPGRAPHLATHNRDWRLPNSDANVGRVADIDNHSKRETPAKAGGKSGKRKVRKLCMSSSSDPWMDPLTMSVSA
jgi:hypothetical protein